MKAEGYRIVHVVPSSLQDPPTPTEPQQWQLHPPSEAVAISHWPKIPDFVFAATEPLPAPALSDLDWHDGQLALPVENFDRPRGRVRGVPLPREAPWPRQSPLLAENAATAELPVPSENIFEIRDRLSLPPQPVAVSSRATETGVSSASDDDSRPVASRRTRRGRVYRGHLPRAAASRVAARPNRAPANARRGPLKHLVLVKKRNV
jgi:hypothetical protein